MALIEIHQSHYHGGGARLTQIERSLVVLLLQGKLIMNDLSALQAKMSELAATAAESNATLAGLAQAVLDLKTSGDVQAGIDELVAEAQAILVGIAAAEDAADDQLPPDGIAAA